jgi:hypothetical protein
VSVLSSLQEHLKTWSKEFLSAIGRNAFRESIAQVVLHQEVARLKAEVRLLTPENIVLDGYKIYSQVDEDGIIESIFSKIGEGGKTFIEIGCGDGSENNTHALVLKGWKGVWVDGNRGNIEKIRKRLPADNSFLVLINQMITRENVMQVLQQNITEIRNDISVDLLSVDIDGNDFYVLEAILQSSKPRVLCVEYNAKFPYPMELMVKYSPLRGWERDDYQGASLACFTRLCERYGYSLVTCNLSGNNAFFVNDQELDNFTLYPPEQLYRPPRYDLIELKSGHPASGKFLRDHCPH